MKRLGKWLLGIAGVLLVLGLVAVVVIATFDWNRAKPWVTHTVSDALGRPVEIGGDLQVRWQRDAELGGWRAWLPTPHVGADKVSIGNAPWGKAKTLLVADRVEFDLALLPLLAHRVDIQQMRFRAPDANLQRRADGLSNWSFADTPSSWTFRL